jgi:hypothetical protein
MRMRLDQRMEMTGTTRVGAGDSTATVVTTLLVISRAFVERRDRDATVLLASTDSVAASCRANAFVCESGPTVRRRS